VLRLPIPKLSEKLLIQKLLWNQCMPNEDYTQDSEQPSSMPNCVYITHVRIIRRQRLIWTSCRTHQGSKFWYHADWSGFTHIPVWSISGLLAERENWKTCPRQSLSSKNPSTLAMKPQKVCLDSWCPGWEFEPRPPNYKSRVLLLDHPARYRSNI
jgi:hypothetical protein